MRVNVERLEGSRVALDFEIEAERVKAAYEQVYKNLSQMLEFPGFRKGRAPRQVILRRLGPEVIEAHVKDVLIPEAYRKALDEEDLSPLEEAKIEEAKVAEGQPMTFRAEVLVRPPIELGEYKGLVIAEAEPAVDEAVVEQEIERLRKRAAQMVEVDDRPCQDGDLVDVEYQIYVDNAPFGGEQLKTTGLKIGEDWFTPSLDDHVRGMSIGEEKTVTARYPEDYRQTALAGREARFELKVKRIRAEVLPEADDEFAQEVAGVNSIEELRDIIREQERRAAKRASGVTLEDRVVRQVVEQAHCELPPSLVDAAIEERKREVAEELRRQRTELSAYLADQGLTQEEWERLLREQAEFQVKRDLVLEEIAEREGIEITPEELAGTAARVMSDAGLTQAEMRQHLRQRDEMTRIYRSLRTARAISLLLETAQIVEPAPGQVENTATGAPLAGAEEDPGADEGKCLQEHTPPEDAATAAPQPAADAPAGGAGEPGLEARATPEEG